MLFFDDFPSRDAAKRFLAAVLKDYPRLKGHVHSDTQVRIDPWIDDLTGIENITFKEGLWRMLDFRLRSTQEFGGGRYTGT